MPRKSVIYALLILFVITLGGCNYLRQKFHSEEPVLARAGNEYLYLSDIKGVVPKGTPPTDSVLMVKNYIDMWLRNRVVLRYAEKNLEASEKDFSRQIEEYRNSLLIYTYETKLIQQKLDTAVSMQEIEEYYEKNKDIFKLRDNIVKMIFFRLSIDSVKAAQVARKMLEADTITNFDQLERFCLLRTSAYVVSLNSWYSFSDLQKLAPIVTYNEELFLKNNRLIELTDDRWRYFIRIYRFLTREATSPLSIEINNIRTIILNARKQELLNQMRNELFERALRKKEIEIYN